MKTCSVVSALCCKSNCIIHANFLTDSPYGDVNGMPDPYLHQAGGNNGEIPQNSTGHPQAYPQYEEDEGGEFSPNGRGRRVIREIIV